MAKTAPWDSHLLKNKQGAYLPCLNNAVAILTHRSEWHNVIAYDAFAGVVIKKKRPPWCEDTAPEDDSLGDWSKEDSLRTVVWITREYNCPVQTYIVDEAVQVVAARWQTHPVRDWLNAQKWDRKSRLDSLFIRLGGAPDTIYTKAVTKNFFLGAVARIMRPGEQVDSVLVLEGKQGAGKSSFFRIVASEPWFLETSINIGSKDGYQALRRKWIVEFAELSALRRSDFWLINQFITAVKDTYRPSYGRSPIDFPRQVVYGGSVNPDGAGYLNDPTGARRFWPIPVKKIDLKALRAERTQLWAEAVYRYRKCEKWHLQDAKLLRAAAEEAEERRQMDPWETHVQEFLGRVKNKKLYAKDGVRIEDLLDDAVQMPRDRQEHSHRIRMGRVLHVIGWGRVVRGSDGARRYLPDE